MLRVVERAVLSQCWFHVNSPFICAGTGLTLVLMSEQFAVMMLFCVQREGAAHLRDRLTLRLLRTQHTAETID